MASTYTDAGIELIGVGEQSNTWGETTNTNWRLMEEMATGVVSISLNGTTSYNLTTTDGATSNGRHLVVQFTGSPGAAATVTVNPDDMQKVYFVDNSTDEPITLTQGSGGDVTVPAGTKKIVYCDGEGSSAKVTDLTDNLSLSGALDLNLSVLRINGTEVTATASELNILDGITASTAELNTLDGIAASTSELNTLEGFTGSSDDLNYAKDLRATGVTATEFNTLDGLTAATEDLNTASTHYVPSGGIIMWSGSISGVPTGWALCNGSNGTPDLRDRFVVGAGGAYAVDAIGGADSVTLTESQIPSHSHSMDSAGSHSHSGSTSTDGSHSHGIDTYKGSEPVTNFIGSGFTAAGPGNGTTKSAGAHDHSLNIDAAGDHAHTINSTGGGESHENRPPYYALAYIMKL